ncbi:hypothetical protein [Actinomadura harenae]|uniref:Uncharacterized protein n=1 Tax=Actinomadura harenae TaxID=2483351 RepID=A0A3M2LI59_9ACTN|nr:hypothetical protein [Actinomadura harenae]RMI37134.1 hypothetical protein EBO15_36655 [Actinomadura harenae]
MSALIASTEYVTSADDDRFGIGVDAEYDYGPVPSPSQHGWFGACEHEITIRVANPDQVEFLLRFETWDGEPTAPESLPEVDGTFLLNISSGVLGVNEGTGGFEPGVITVQPGRYYARISGYGRNSAAESRDATGERYLTQLWPTREARC